MYAKRAWKMLLEGPTSIDQTLRPGTGISNCALLLFTHHHHKIKICWRHTSPTDSIFRICHPKKVVWIENIIWCALNVFCKSSKRRKNCGKTRRKFNVHLSSSNMKHQLWRHSRMKTWKKSILNRIAYDLNKFSEQKIKQHEGFFRQESPLYVGFCRIACKRLCQTPNKDP